MFYVITTYLKTDKDFEPYPDASIRTNEFLALYCANNQFAVIADIDGLDCNPTVCVDKDHPLPDMENITGEPICFGYTSKHMVTITAINSP